MDVVRATFGEYPASAMSSAANNVVTPCRRQLTPRFRGAQRRRRRGARRCSHRDQQIRLAIRRSHRDPRPAHQAMLPNESGWYAELIAPHSLSLRSRGRPIQR
jgi:hypothetical protein